MKHGLTLLFLVPVLFAAAQAKTDWDKEGLKGKVKSVKTSENYRYKEKGQWRQWEPSYGSLQTFSSTGQRTKTDNFQKGDQPYYSVEYKYRPDKTGGTQITTGQGGKITSRKEWKANAKGDVTEEAEYYADTLSRIYKFIYDDKGFWVEYSGFKPDGSITSRTFYTNNAKGQMIEKKYTQPKYASSIITYEYDAKGNLGVEKWPGGNGLHSFRFERTYDDKNNIVRELKYMDENPKAYETTWIYEYDKKGNWLKKTQYTAEGEPFSIQERVIVYY